MARLSHRNKVVKCRKSSELEVSVGKAPSSAHNSRPPCPKKCYPTPLHITFNVHSRKLYYDSSIPHSWSLIGEEQQPTGEKTVCLDRRFLQCDQHMYDYKSCMDISDVLDSLNVKEYLHEGITGQIMDYGVFMRGDGKRIPKDLIVNMVFLYRFRGNRDSVHKVLQKSWQNSESQLCAEGIKHQYITSDSISS